MNLVDLDPRWLILDGERVGFVFKSPADPRWYQSCVFRRMPFREQCALLRTVGLVDEDGMASDVQTCDPKCAWRIESGDSFENLTVKPSLDGSKGGLWHGFITDGKIV